MLDAEGAHNDIQVGAAAGVHDPSDIPWRMTAWSAGGVDVGSVKATKKAGEGRKQPASVLNGKTVTFDMHGSALGENDAAEGLVPGGVLGAMGAEQSAATVDHRGQAPVSSEVAEWVVLTADERKALKKLKQARRKLTTSAHKAGGGFKGGHDNAERTSRHLASLTRQ